MLSQAKNNLGRLDLPSLTYAVQSATVETPEGDANVGRLHFTGESAKSVADILADAGAAGERTERAECAEWLKQTLGKGPRLSREVEGEAENIGGFSRRTLTRARKHLLGGTLLPGLTCARCQNARVPGLSPRARTRAREDPQSWHSVTLPR